LGRNNDDSNDVVNKSRYNLVFCSKGSSGWRENGSLATAHGRSTL
jgi:hypothetical protein